MSFIPSITETPTNIDHNQSGAHSSKRKCERLKQKTKIVRQKTLQGLQFSATSLVDEYVTEKDTFVGISNGTQTISFIKTIVQHNLLACIYKLCML